MKNHPTHSSQFWSRLLYGGTCLAIASALVSTWEQPAEANIIRTIRGIFTGDTGEGASGKTRGGAIRDEYCGADLATAPHLENPVGEPVTNPDQLVVLAFEWTEETTQPDPEIFLYLPFADSDNAPSPIAPASETVNRPQASPAGTKGIELPGLESTAVPETVVRENLIFEFELRDATNTETLERARFELPEAIGIVRLPLTTAGVLETDETYFWNFRLICQRETVEGASSDNAATDSDDPATVEETEEQIVFGRIQRVETPPELEAALENKPPFDRYEAYLNSGIWFDMVAALATDPASPEWTALLKEWNIPTDNPVPQVLTPLADESGEPQSD